jgi:L,D-transpeptidase catalytic domain
VARLRRSRLSLLAGLGPFLFGAASPPDGAVVRAATTPLNVRAAPNNLSDRIGVLAEGAAVLTAPEPLEGPGCADGWVALVDGGFACGEFLAPSTGTPQAIPELVAFDPPTPDEYASYRDDGSYDAEPVASAPRLLPFIYGKQWRGWKGAVYASAAHYEHGDSAMSALERGSKHAFIDAVDTSRGQVLVQDDGSVVPLDQVFLFPVSRFAGRDLVADPAPRGTRPAWVYGYDGASVREAPTPKAAVGATLAFQQAIVVQNEPATPDGRWWRVPGGLGGGEDGYVDAKSEVRVWQPAPPPADLPAGLLWLDVDTDTQLLAVINGDEPVYMTLVSTGTSGRYETPTGLYSIKDKAAWGDMASLVGADEAYHVEKVPWIAHFWPRYALHGVFWHWGFGNKASHGCVNLAPLDAAWIFAHVAPTQPDGWHTVWSTIDNPGATLRIRKGLDLDLVDRRKGR